MKVFDASSLIHAWNNYPFEQFPPFWDWLTNQIDAQEIVIPREALTEVSQISPECHGWLTRNKLQIIEVSNDIANEASRIKRLIGVVNDNYHPKGVDENDIIIISTAKILGVGLVPTRVDRRISPWNRASARSPAYAALRRLTSGV